LATLGARSCLRLRCAARRALRRELVAQLCRRGALRGQLRLQRRERGILGLRRLRIRGDATRAGLLGRNTKKGGRTQTGSFLPQEGACACRAGSAASHTLRRARRVRVRR
jgi:hypothetical protein